MQKKSDHPRADNTKLAMNRVALAGVAGRDAETRDGVTSQYVAFSLLHIETQADGSERRLIVGVYCPSSLIDRAAKIKRGDNVVVFGALRILKSQEVDDMRPYVEIQASHVGVLAHG